MISIDFCEKMSHATTRLDVFRRAVVSPPAIFFPRKPEVAENAIAWSLKAYHEERVSTDATILNKIHNQCFKKRIPWFQQLI